MAEGKESTNVPPQRASASGHAAVKESDGLPPDVVVRRSKSRIRPFRGLRGEISTFRAVFLGLAGIAAVFIVWWLLTWGETPERRWLNPTLLPSPGETFADFPRLWFEEELTRNAAVSLRRVVLGFGLAAVVGVPLGILCGCFRSLGALLAPLLIVGRNIPVAALIPLTFFWFGIGEQQKVMFIFIACVAFVVIDSANAVGEISGRYIDTAYTLGASRRQIITKVIVPLAMPSIFNSLRMLFGIAFGYIMLAELVRLGSEAGGLGFIINSAQRRGIRTYILLVLMIIPLIALAVDRVLYWVQRQLFPHCYGGEGLLHRAWKAVSHGLEDLMLLFRRPVEPPQTLWTAEPSGSSDNGEAGTTASSRKSQDSASEKPTAL